MSRAGWAGLFGAVCLILGLLGPLEQATEAIGVATGMIVFVASALRCRDREARIGPLGDLVSRALGWLPLLAGLPLIVRAHQVETRLAVAGAIVLLTPSPARAAGCAFATAAIAWRLALARAPVFWGTDVELSRALSGAVGWATGQAIDLGPTASGLDLFVAFLLLLAVRRWEGGGNWQRAAAGAAILCAYIALLNGAGAATSVLLDRLGPLNRAGEHLAPAPQEIARVMFGWLPVLFGTLCLLQQRAQARASSWNGKGGGRAAAAAAGLGLLLAALLILPGRPLEHRRPGDVVLLKSPAFDLAVPSVKRLGQSQAGMFGLLPRYLALDGHATRIQEGPIDAGALVGASVVVAPLPTSVLGALERERLEEFVERGGSLLVLGDHTDLLGIMAPINDLAGPHGIQLRFDSAFPAVRQWHASLEGARIDRHAETGIGTGASLQIRGLVRPLVIGRYALSDAGDRSNVGRGAYMGDDAYQPGEQLGDLVLAASVQVGDGRIVAFGDTSSFQNLVLPFSYPFVASLVDDLARPASRRDVWWDTAAAVIAVALGGAALAGSTGCSVALLLAVGLAACASGAAAGPSPLERIPHGARVALVDEAHLNGFSHDFWNEESIGGLIVNLQRAGYLPLVVADGAAMRPADEEALPVLVAPRRPIARAEAIALARHLERGGDLLLAAGGDQREAVAPLLSMYGISIGRLPLGPVPVEPDMDRRAYDLARKRPQFRRAWPLRSDGIVASRSIFRAFDRDIVLEALVGSAHAGRDDRGRLLVIGDPDFLTDRVLEEENGAWEGNVDLLARILARGEEP